MEKLFEGNIRKKFFFFCLPLIFSTVMSQAHLIIDSIMLGRFVGDYALGAASSVSDFITLIQHFFGGYSGGAIVYVAMLFGKGDYKKMANVMKANILVTSAIAVVLSVTLILAHKPLFAILKVPQEIYKESFEYFAVILSGLILINVNTHFVHIFNAVNKNKIAVTLSIVSCVLNISGNYLLIKVFNLGVLGAAMATIFSWVVATIVYIFYFVHIFKLLNLRVRDIYWSTSELKKSASLGFPNMLQQSIMYLCSTLISPLKNSCGAFALSGFSVGMKVYNINAQIYQTSNKVISSYIAQCVGAGKLKMINKGIKIGISQTAMLLLPVLVICVLGAEVIPNMFFNEASSPQSMQYAQTFLKFVLPFAVFNAINNMLHQIFRGAGASRYLVISTAVYSVSNLVFSYILFQKYEMYGIFAGMVLAWISEAIFGGIIFFGGKWKPKKGL